ncbi:hypothetical protein, partial [Pseudoalteromonas peptidolytica]
RAKAKKAAKQAEEANDSTVEPLEEQQSTDTEQAQLDTQTPEARKKAAVKAAIAKAKAKKQAKEQEGNEPS